MILGVDGVSDFDPLHLGKHNEKVQLYAFDVLAMDGDNLRALPLSMRKANLERLLALRSRALDVGDDDLGLHRDRVHGLWAEERNAPLA